MNYGQQWQNKPAEEARNNEFAAQAIASKAAATTEAELAAQKARLANYNAQLPADKPTMAGLGFFSPAAEIVAKQAAANDGVNNFYGKRASAEADQAEHTSFKSKLDMLVNQPLYHAAGTSQYQTNAESNVLDEQLAEKNKIAAARRSLGEVANNSFKPTANGLLKQYDLDGKETGVTVLNTELSALDRMELKALGGQGVPTHRRLVKKTPTGVEVVLVPLTKVERAAAAPKAKSDEKDVTRLTAAEKKEGRPATAYGGLTVESLRKHPITVPSGLGVVTADENGKLIYRASILKGLFEPTDSPFKHVPDIRPSDAAFIDNLEKNIARVSAAKQQQ